MTLEELEVVISAETEPLKQQLSIIKDQMSGLEKSTNQITSGIKGAFKKMLWGIIALKIGQKIGQAIVSGVRESLKVEAAIQQIKRIMGESSNQFLKWAETQALAFNMSQGQAIRYGAVFGNLVSSFAKNSQEAMTYTTDLLKASSIIASSTGRSMEDVMERIRSGLLGNTEAIEDLGVNVNVAMIESTEAFRKFANGKSWQQLDFQTQQQIRLMAILEQTTKKYGDTVAQNTSSQLQQLVAILDNVRLKLGQAFTPILQIILPVLTALAQKLYYVMDIIAQFSQALFGKTNNQGGVTQKQIQNTNNQAKAMTKLGNATEKAGKQAKGALAGFDEINSLNLDDSSAGGAGGGSTGDTGSMSMPDMDIGSIGDNVVEVSEQIQQMADKLKSIFRGIKKIFEDIWDSEPVQAFVDAVKIYGAFLLDYWKTLLQNIRENIINTWENIAPNLAVTLENLLSLWTMFWNDITQAIIQFGPQIINNVITLFNSIWADAIDPAIQFVVKVWADFTSILKDLWGKYGKDILNNIGEFIVNIQKTFQLLWDNVLQPIIKPFLEMLNWLWDKHLKGLVQQVGEFIMKLVNGALEIWNKFISPIINWLIEKLGPVFSNVFAHIINVFGTVVGAVADVAKGIFKVLGGIIDFIVGVFTGNWRKAWQGIKDIFSGVFGSLAGIVKYPLNLIIDAINTVIRGLNRININIPDWDWIPDKYQGKKFGINIPTIPKLAQGGYIGPNSPVLAMIGDNRNEGEIVAPESKIYEQTYRAIKDALGSNSGDKTLVLNLNVVILL